MARWMLIKWQQAKQALGLGHSVLEMHMRAATSHASRQNCSSRESQGDELSSAEHTCFNGGLQLAQAGSDLSIHLALACWLLREGVAVGTKCLTDLHNQPEPLRERLQHLCRTFAGRLLHCCPAP